MGEKENNIKKANLHITRKERRKREECPNCNITLEHYMNFCPHCGQENHIKRATVGLLITDFLKDYWTFDSKLFRSLNPLITKPGFLTNEFLKGKRQRYIPPIRLYIFISFIFFLSLSIINSFDKGNNDTVANEFSAGLSEGMNLSNNDTSINYKQKDSIYKDSIMGGFIEYSSNSSQKDFDDYIIKDIETNPVLREQFKGISKDSVIKLMKASPFTLNIYRRSFELQSKEGVEKFKKIILDKIPIVLFILIPIFAFILFLLFYNKKRFYVDYLVFALHLQSFAFIQLLINNLLDLFNTSGWLGIVMFVLFIVYAVVAAKKVFDKTYTGTFFRLLGATIIYAIVSTIAFVTTLVIIMGF